MKKIFALLITTILLSAGLSSCKQSNNTEIKKEVVSSLKFETHSISELSILMNQNPDAILLDVRTPEETAEGMIPGAIQLDFESDTFETEVVKLDKSETYLIYCRSGNRSRQAGEFMNKNGFKHIINLDGGYTRYSELNHN